MSSARKLLTVTMSSMVVAGVVGCGTEPQHSRMIPSTINTVNGPVTAMHPQGSPFLEKIIGDNDLTPVLNDGANIPEKYRSLIDAFGLISMGCTATHIGKGIVLTAGHCFDAPKDRTDDVACPDVTIKWGFRKDKPAYLVSKCTKILAYELSDDRDYAIFTVDQIPTASVAVDLTTRPAINTPLTIFGFPQARPLEWSKTCTLQPASNGTNYGSDQFTHQCDTEPGNSGSTILDDNSLKIVGIHDGGMAPWNYGTFLIDTPLAEILSGNKPTPGPTPTPSIPDMKFGPFTNDEDRDLVVLDGKGQGFPQSSGVSFQVVTKLENKYDYVIVRDAAGKTTKATGQGTKTFRGLKLPVTIHLTTDPSVTSDSVELRAIVFN